MRFISVLTAACLFMALGAPIARAQISDDVVRIGVLNDQSGLYADLGGPGSVVGPVGTFSATAGLLLQDARARREQCLGHNPDVTGELLQLDESQPVRKVVG